MVKLITVTGYFNTGSSAVTDLLSEYSTVQGFGEYELRIAHEPDGLSDLEYNIVDNNHRHNTSNAIKRFKKYINYCNGNIFSKRYRNIFGNDFLTICDKYLDSLVDLTTKSWWQFDQIYRGKIFYFVDVLYSRIIRTLVPKWKENRYTLFLNNEKAFFSYKTEEEFLNLTTKFTNELISSAWNGKSEFMVLDQLVPPSNIKRYERYFNNLHTFVIDRDPRDIYLLERLNPYGVVPLDVKEFCKWFKIIREHRKHESKSNNELFLQFEDLVYFYESTKEKIVNFINLDETNHVNKFKAFDPNKSIKNTRLWVKNNKYKKEIEFIESELKEFLYDYSFLEK